MAIYAASDLHGRYDLFLKIKAALREGDHVFFLGDAGDRGLRGWDIIKEIYSDPQFTYIKGNHEDMLAEAIRAYAKNPERVSKQFNLLKQNGGESTFVDWWSDGADISWAKKLTVLPTHKEYINENNKKILLSHAGYTPWIDENGEILFPSDFDLIWDRSHFYDIMDECCNLDCIVVHGHTPIPHLAEDLLDKREDIPNGTYWYDNDKKVCIDNLSVFTGCACLLNLDTFDEIIVSSNNIL